MIEQIRELIQDLHGKYDACEANAENYRPSDYGYSRCKGKASAYRHCAELLANILKDHSDGSIPRDDTIETDSTSASKSGTSQTGT